MANQAAALAAQQQNFQPGGKLSNPFLQGPAPNFSAPGPVPPPPLPPLPPPPSSIPTPPPPPTISKEVSPEVPPKPLPPKPEEKSQEEPIGEWPDSLK